MAIHRHALRKQGAKTKLFGRYKKKNIAEARKAAKLWGAKVEPCKGGVCVIRRGSKKK